MTRLIHCQFDGSALMGRAHLRSGTHSCREDLQHVEVREFELRLYDRRQEDAAGGQGSAKGAPCEDLFGSFDEHVCGWKKQSM